MAHLRCSSLNERGISDFDEFIHKKFLIILRSCLEALNFDPTTLIEIAVCIGDEFYYLQCDFFPSENKNLFKNLDSLNFC